MRKIYSILFVLASLLLISSCNQDDSFKNAKSSSKSKKLKIWRFPVNQVLEQVPTVNRKITELKSKAINSRLTSSLYDFSIDENEVQVIFGINYTQYTFIVLRDDTTNNTLENYICKVFDNGVVQQFLITYPQVSNQNGIVYELNNPTMITINDQSMVVGNQSRGFGEGCVPSFTETTWSYQCIDIACSDGGHQVGNNDCRCGITADCTPAHTECSWISSTVWHYNCPSGGGDTGGDGDLDLGQGGGSSGNNDDSNDDEVVTVPFDDSRARAKECEKINNILNFVTNASTNETYRDKLISLSSHVTNNQNEYGVYLNSNDIVGYPTPDYTLKFLKTISYKAMSHTHNDDTEGKYSVFSFKDLIGISELLHLNKIITTEFVATLSTFKGTHYVLTISDVDKFKNFFYSHNNIAGSTGFNFWKNNWEKLEKINEKYYNGKTPLIKQNDTNNDTVLGHFLDMMNEADLGISLYKSNANFNSFTRVIKDKTTGLIKEDICN